jgi:hypothetical protein
MFNERRSERITHPDRVTAAPVKLPTFHEADTLLILLLVQRIGQFVASNDRFRFH